MESACIDVGFGWDEVEAPKKRAGKARRLDRIRTLADCKQGDIVLLGIDDTEYRVAWFSGKEGFRKATLYPVRDRCLRQDGSNCKVLGEATPCAGVRLQP